MPQNENGLASPKTAKELLDLYFLDVRSALLETAAALDRVQRAAGADSIFSDPRLHDIYRAMDVLADGRENRVERILLRLSHLDGNGNHNG
ncbi:MAG: hypothetical protein AB1921_07680 [Thermodesulfobacteriota bacterium]